MNNDFYINSSLSFRILWSPFTSTHVNVNVLLKNSSISLFGAALAGLDLLIEVALHEHLLKPGNIDFALKC